MTPALRIKYTAARSADDPDEAWREYAACRGMKVALFFPTRGSSDLSASAKEVCATCPVSEPCRRAGMGEHFGVWGGLSERQRRRLRSTGEQLAPVESLPRHKPLHPPPEPPKQCGWCHKPLRLRSYCDRVCAEEAARRTR